VHKGCTDQQASVDRTDVDIGDGASLEFVDMFCYLGDMLSVDGDADAGAEASICKGWNKFRQLGPMLTNKDVSPLMRGKLYRSCVCSFMLHGGDLWPVNKGNELTLQRAEMRMIRWVCGIKVTDRFSSSELRKRLGVDDIIAVIQHPRLRWYGHVLRKDENDWVRKCMDFKVEWVRPKGRPKKTWSEVTEKGCHTRQIYKEDAVDHRKWRKLHKDVVY